VLEARMGTGKGDVGKGMLECEGYKPDWWVGGLGWLGSIW
jgi:hypothetical protein